MAFQRAGDAQMVTVSTVHHLQQVACKTWALTPVKRQDAFARAAHSFEHYANVVEDPREQHAHYATGARCYIKGRLHQNVIRS